MHLTDPKVKTSVSQRWACFTNTECLKCLSKLAETMGSVYGSCYVIANLSYGSVVYLIGPIFLQIVFCKSLETRNRIYRIFSGPFPGLFGGADATTFPGKEIGGVSTNARIFRRLRRLGTAAGHYSTALWLNLVVPNLHRS